MADLNGFVKIYRQIIRWGWYRDIPVKVLFLHCLFMANYQQANWYGVTIERGSFVTSIDELSQQTGLTVQSTRTALKKLISTGEIAKKSTNRHTVITVVNYDKFQENSLTSKNGYKSMNKLLTSQKSNINSNKQINKDFNSVENYEKSAQQGISQDVENLTLTNKPTSKLTRSLTNEQQTANKQLTSQLTTNEEVKEIKNNKEYKEVVEVELSYGNRKELFSLFPEMDWDAYEEADFKLRPAGFYCNTNQAVFLSSVQEDYLINYLGIETTEHYIKKLADFIVDKNANIKNHFATILKWSKEDGNMQFI